MNRREIEDAIELLDSAIPREEARVKLHQYGGGPDEGQVIANEAGYLRLGVELLKAAFAPPHSSQEPSSVDVDIDYLITEDSTINFDWFERRDMPSSEPSPPLSRVVPVLIGCSFIAAALLAVIGLVTVVRWLAA